MADALAPSLVALAAYLCGSIPFGVIVARRQGVDIQDKGSGNIGATNVARTLGKKQGALVLLLDALKGALPMVVLHFLPVQTKLGPYLLTLVGAAVIIGHCYSIWLGFSGGKGVATTLGVFLVVTPSLAIIAVALFAVCYLLFRTVSIASLVAAAAFPLLLWLFEHSSPEVLLGLAAAAIIFVSHRDNLRRLRAGEEHRL